MCRISPKKPRAELKLLRIYKSCLVNAMICIHRTVVSVPFALGQTSLPAHELSYSNFPYGALADDYCTVSTMNESYHVKQLGGKYLWNKTYCNISAWCRMQNRLLIKANLATRNIYRRRWIVVFPATTCLRRESGEEKRSQERFNVQSAKK